MTGVGLVSPLGIGTEANWEALCDGPERDRSDHPLRRVAVLGADCGRGQGFRPAAVRGQERCQEDGHLHPVRDGCRAIRGGRCAAGGDAGAPTRVGVYIASGIGGFRQSSANTRRCMKGGPRRISPFFIPASIINLAAGQVSIRFGASGPNLATCTACTASAHAIGEAFEIIRRGDAEIMIAGGSEAAITPMGVGGFAAMRALSTRNDDPTRASRPFDKDRDGFVMGEGAGIVILEELASAKRRGATIYAELVGYGMTSRRVPHHGASPRTATAAIAVDAHGAEEGRRSNRRRSTTSTRTAHRPLSTTKPRRWPSSGCSASMPTSLRCPRPSR